MIEDAPLEITENYIKNANQKLNNKNCDAIILNDISNWEIGLKSDDNEVYFSHAGPLPHRKDNLMLVERCKY